ncbi:hypothetical protein HMPREF0061_1303 [Aerococcus viridans ATCC 11563 = CCUG 4311]|uniref:Uncharacterized protein n=1 Tax=Aerococcus viridans (strain ATCC 11563 / DSM 20340 / CCUG 4311 / JCM 20461 / NBRC 12219 / NCTC 8251 / M1) TaxID=655812 RepID=A0ABN0A7T6_AERVM|nr:hypothetical protein HMPREF0061_1303 [Aerococcus viridans ATCC 11563 = CCUG 4311]
MGFVRHLMMYKDTIKNCTWFVLTLMKTGKEINKDKSTNKSKSIKKYLNK